MGSKNHEVVPTNLVAQISQLRHGGSHKILGDLAKRNLVAKVKNSKCMHVICAGANDLIIISHSIVVNITTYT